MWGDMQQRSSGSGVKPVTPAQSLCIRLHHIVTTHPNPTLDAEHQAGRIWVPVLLVFGMTRPGIEPQPPSLRADTLNSSVTTELVGRGQ